MTQKSFGNRQTVRKPSYAKSQDTAQEILSKQKSNDGKTKPPIYPDEEDLKSNKFPQFEVPGVKSKDEEIPGKPAPSPAAVDKDKEKLAKSKTKEDASKGKN